MVSQSRSISTPYLATLLLVAQCIVPMLTTFGFQIVAPLSNTGRVQQRIPSLSALYVASSAPPLDEQKPHQQQPRGGVGKIVEIESRNEFEQFLAEDDRLCIVK